MRDLFLALLTVTCFLVCPTAAQDVDTVLHVDKMHPEAADANPGSTDRPLSTLQEAVDRAVANKRDQVSTRVVVGAGVYREAIDLATYTNVKRGQYDTVDPDNQTPMFFEAEIPGSVVISGSDVWTEWQRRGDRFVHDWPFDWGAGVEEIRERREMVFIDGELKTQVMSRDRLGESADHLKGTGSYFVDDSEQKLYLQPTGDSTMSSATVEVGVRSTLWDHRGEDYVTIRGFVFQHASTQWDGGQAAVRILESEHVRIENCQFRWNNWQGLYLGDTENVTIRRSTFNYNGGQGWNTWRVRNMVAEHTETSYNNWRGALGEHYGWNVGNKLMKVHGLVLRNHRAVGNLSRGVWLDYDISNAVLDDLVVQDNRLDGIWVEASQGPVTIKNSLIRGNQRSGLRATYAERVTVANNVFAYNAEGEDVIQNDSQIILDGGDEREVENFVTGEAFYPVLRDWKIVDNVFVGGPFKHPHASGPCLIDTDLDQEDWTTFVATLRADKNTYFHPEREAVFGYPDEEDLTLDEWQRRTGQDHTSEFREPPL